MAEDLMKALSNLEEMLKEIPQDQLIKPHLEEGEVNSEVEAPKEEENNHCIKNGSYVRVEDDCMKAWIYLNPPKQGEDYYSRDLIMQFLAEYGVVAGFHTSNIAAIAKKHVYEREILVAKGKEAVRGEPGFYEFFFDTGDKRHPLIREDGTVDYSSMSSLSNVEEGQLIARYHHSVKSEDGYDVLGKAIASKPAKDLLPLRGKGFSNAKNPDEYYATISGKIEYKNGHIDIKDVHEIRGDVDMITGKVEFFGDIHIQGNVGTGVVIRSSRNVTVDGVVEAATIYAGGDVVLKRGIQGAQKAHIVARGTVCAEFIEHTKVEAGDDIRANSFLNSDVYSAGKIKAEGKQGIILGGHVRGLLGVSAQNIGNDAETKTAVSCGYSAEDYAHYVDAFQRETEAQKLLSDTVEKMTELLKIRRLGKDVIPEKTDRDIAFLNEKKDEYFEALDKARTEKEELTKIIEKGKGSVILANDKIFRGVTICVEGNVYKVERNTSFMKYHNEAGKIVQSVIVAR